MNKKTMIITGFAVMAALGMNANAITTKWTLVGEGNWTNAANWDLGVPTAADSVVFEISGAKIILDSEVSLVQFYNRRGSAPETSATLDIVTNGVLTASGKVMVAGFGLPPNLYADLHINGGSLNVKNDFTVAGDNLAEGVGTLIMNSGTINASNNFYVGHAGRNTGVTGVATINGGVLNVVKNTRIGGGKLETDTGTLNLYDGTFNANVDTNFFGPFRISFGVGSGTVNLYGGTVTNNGALEMERDETNDVGTATLNLVGGEWWQNNLVYVEDESVIHFEEGVFYWQGSRVSAFSNLVTNNFVTWSGGLTNMLTESWNVSFTNGTSILYVDYNDAQPGYTTVWAYDTNPPTEPTPYETFALSYGLVEGPEGDDDKDGVSNLAEFAVNGNPTNAFDKGQTATANDATYFIFTHAKLEDDSSLQYRLIDTTDLINGTSLRTNAWDAQSLGPINGDYRMVTNKYSRTSDSLFVELEIEMP